MAFVSIYLCSQNIYRMFNDYGTHLSMDITTYTMILLCKLWMLSWAYKDGGEEKKNLTAEQFERRVVQLPSLFEYFGYVFFCTGSIVGPVFEYTDFINFINLTGNYATLPRGHKASVSILPGLKLFGYGLAALAIHMSLVSLGFDVYWCGSKEYITYGSIWKKIAYYYISVTNQRIMYYVPWYIIDGACTLIGLTYNGSDPKTNEHRWDRMFSVNAFYVEFSSNPMEIMTYWNHNIHLWLKRYVQERVVAPGEKTNPLATFIVFTVSAIWHGFYPFYYFMFFMCGFVIEIAKDIYRARILFSWVPYPKIVCHFLAMIILNYLGTSFMLLTFEKGFNFGKATNFFGFVLLPVLMITVKYSGIV